MADRIVTAEKADRTPNWDKWPLIPNCTLWECVALSLNIDPDKVHKEWLEINLVIKESRKFNDRIAVALANAGDTGALRPTGYTMDSKCWAVSLRQFAAWVRERGWDAPAELLAMADDHNRTPSDRRTSGATATREARKAGRLGDLKRFIEDVCKADDLGTIVTLKPGPKRYEINQLAEMLAGKFSVD
jgi:hypothetical protein